MRAVQIFLACIGRILISLIFILSSIGHMMNWQASVTYLTNGLHHWTTPGAAMGFGMSELQSLVDHLIPHASVLMGIAVVLMLVGGLFVFFGIKTRFGAFLLMLFIIPTSILIHSFWLLQGSDRELQMMFFMRNVSILGGLFYLLAFGNGPKVVQKATKAPEEKK